MTSAVTSDVEVHEKKWTARRFQVTINQAEKYDDVVKYLTDKALFRFLYSCKEEAPSTGHVHFHIYVCYSNTVTLYKSRLLDQHCEVCRGSHVKNMEYIEKNGDIKDRIGQEPHQGCQYSFSDFRQIDDPSTIPVNQFKTWTYVKQYNQALTRDMIYKPGIVVHYIWGDSGVGKTKKVFDMIGDDPFDRVSFHNNFWEGVSMDTSVKIAWYDDFRDSDMKPSEFIKFIDYYANNLNIKGSHVLNHYTTIYITSVQSPEDLYKNMTLEEPRKQWLRRLDIIHLE